MLIPKKWEAMQLTKAKKLSFTEGALFFKILCFAMPIMATGMLQVLYNMADNIIVGRFSGDDNALGAVGSTSSLSHLTLNFMLGIAAGTSILVAQAYGARQENKVSRTVHTALSFSLILGVAFMILGLIISRPALMLIGTDESFIDGAVLYFRIICFGIPATAVCNFGAGILRSVGDSKTPLVILSSAGLINVGLNLVFVLCFGMSVAGVALATVISQYFSAITIVLWLYMKKGQCYSFSFKKLCFDIGILKRVLRLGIPAGIQSSIFSLSNIFLMSSVNSLAQLPQYGKHVVTAYTVAGNIDAITYTACNSFHHAALTFTGQNLGAGKPDRIKKTLIFSLLQVAFVGIMIGQVELIFGEQLTTLYIDSTLTAEIKESITAMTMDILYLLLNVYFLCGVMDVLSGVLKGLGYSIAPQRK